MLLALAGLDYLVKTACPDEHTAMSLAFEKRAGILLLF
jgi:hypothetical protein